MSDWVSSFKKPQPLAFDLTIAPPGSVVVLRSRKPLTLEQRDRAASEIKAWRAQNPGPVAVVIDGTAWDAVVIEGSA